MENEFYKKLIERTLRRLSIIAPEILYKYRDWSLDNHKRLITNQELYCADPLTLNDAWDGKNPVRWDSTTYEEYIEMNKAFVFDKSGMTDSEIYAKAKELTDKKIGFYPDMTPEANEPKYSPNESIGIVSLSDKADIELLWAYYCNGHKGFVVGLDSQILKQYGPSFLEPINYVDKYPLITITDPDSFTKQYFTKIKAWQHEAEWRFVLNKINFRQHPNKRVLNLPKEAFKEIVIGFMTPDEERQEIINAVRKHLPAAKLLQAENNFHSIPYMTFHEIK